MIYSNDMDKLKTKIAIYKTILGITMGSAIYGGINAKAYNDSVEHLATVPSTLRYELYYNGTLDQELLPPFNPAGDRTDNLITYEVLDKLNHLTIDLTAVKDLSYVLKCHNLLSISIFNAEYLTKEQIDIIKNSSANNITLYYTNPSIHREDHLDLNVFGDKEIDINFYPNEELEALVLKNYLLNTDKDNVTVNYIGNHGNIDVINRIDKKLDEIISSIGLTDKDTDYDKLIKICKYVNDKIQYDVDIANYLENKNTDNKDIYFQLSNYYNEYDLSSIIFNENNNIDGVCVNYANLLDILCYKANVKCRTINGNHDTVGHAWNVIYLNDTKSYIDLTAADTTYINKYIDNYLNATTDLEKENAKNNIDTILLMSLNTHKSYELYNSVDSLDSNPNVIEVNYNEGLDGKDILHKELPKKTFALIGYGSAIFLIGSYELLKKIVKYLELTREQEIDDYYDDSYSYCDQESNVDDCIIYNFEDCKKLLKRDDK